MMSMTSFDPSFWISETYLDLETSLAAAETLVCWDKAERPQNDCNRKKADSAVRSFFLIRALNLRRVRPIRTHQRLPKRRGCCLRNEITWLLKVPF